MFGTKKIPLLMILTATSLIAISSVDQSNNTHLSKDTVAFWYEEWQPGLTLSKLEPANVVIGVPPTAIPEIHKSGRRALQYITYYQARFNTAFLKNRDDLDNVAFRVNGQWVKSAFGGEDNYVLCPNSVELESRVLQFVDKSLQSGFDGYFIDNTFLEPAAHQQCTAQHKHLRRGLTAGEAYVDLVNAVQKRFKSANPAALLIINPGNPATLESIAPTAGSLWDVCDYVLWESYGYSSHRGAQHDRWDSTVQGSIAISHDPLKAAKILALSYPTDLAEARFSFATASVFGFSWSANLGERDEKSSRDGGRFGAFLNEIPFNLGKPVGPVPQRPERLLHRTFSNGEVFVNLGSNPQHISVAIRGVIFLGGQRAQKITSASFELPAMTSAIILHEHAETERP